MSSFDFGEFVGDDRIFAVSQSRYTEEEADWDKHYKERFIDTADPEWTVTIVDCYVKS